MNHLIKRSLSLIMAVLMVLAMIPANPVHVHAEEVVDSVSHYVNTTGANDAGLTTNTKTSCEATPKPYYAYEILPGGSITFKLEDSAAFLRDFDNKATIEVEVVNGYGVAFDFYYVKKAGGYAKTTYKYTKSGANGTTIAVYEVTDAGFNGKILKTGDAIGIMTKESEKNVYIRSVKITKGIDTGALAIGNPSSGYTNCGDTAPIYAKNDSKFDKFVYVTAQIKKGEQVIATTTLAKGDKLEANKQLKIVDAGALNRSMAGEGTFTVTFTGYWNVNDEAHKIDTTIIYERTAHTYENACDATCNVCAAERTVGDHVYSNACDTTCNECDEERVVGDHVYSNACDATCNVCAAEREVEDHKWQPATFEAPETCSVCSATRGEKKIAVAKIGETKFESLAEAIKKAVAGDTITLVADNAEDVTIDKNLTIECADKAYTGTITLNEGVELTAPEGLTVVPTEEGCYVPYANGVYSVARYTVQNVQTGANYTSVDIALLNAGEYETIKMWADGNTPITTIGEGITLDLNGKKLESSYVACFGNIIDSSEANSGRLQVELSHFLIQKSNSQLPVNTENGYAFVDIAFQEAVKGTNYYFETGFEKAAHDLLLKGQAVSGVTVVVRISWNQDNGTRNQEFVYDDGYVKQFIASYGVKTPGKYGKMFALTLKGVDPENQLTFTAIVRSNTGVEYVSNNH